MSSGSQPPSDSDLAVRISVSLSTSHPTLSRTRSQDPGDEFAIIISARIAYSSRPGTAVTFWANTGGLFNTDGQEIFTSGGKYGIRLHRPDGEIQTGQYWYHYSFPDGWEPDMREGPNGKLVVVPAEGTLEVRHPLSWKRVLEAEPWRVWDAEGGRWEVEVEDGEVWTAKYGRAQWIRPWWCWGDKDGPELEGRLLHMFIKGTEAIGRRPPPEWQVAEGCVVGELQSEIYFDFENEEAQFEIAP